MKDKLRRIRRIAKAAVGRDLFQRRQVRLSVEFHGFGTGRWAINPVGINADSVIYSFGVGSDISFEESIINRYGVTTHAFDPTPRSKAWIANQTLPSSFKFHDYGLANFDGVAHFRPPEDPTFVSYTVLERVGAVASVEGKVCRLSTIMDRLGHDRIDILKMDIEGSEYGVVPDIVGLGLQVGQLLVEFHHRFEGVGLDRTRDAIRCLMDAGYKLFYSSPRGEEFSFIRRP